MKTDKKKVKKKKIKKLFEKKKKKKTKIPAYVIMRRSTRRSTRAAFCALPALPAGQNGCLNSSQRERGREIERGLSVYWNTRLALPAPLHKCSVPSLHYHPHSITHTMSDLWYVPAELAGQWPSGGLLQPFLPLVTPWTTGILTHELFNDNC